MGTRAHREDLDVVSVPHPGDTRYLSQRTEPLFFVKPHINSPESAG